MPATTEQNTRTPSTVLTRLLRLARKPSPPEHERKSTPAAPGLGITDFHGNVASTNRDTIAFWRLPEVDWEGMTVAERDNHREQWAQVLANLSGANGARVWLYGDHVRLPVSRWAEAETANAPAPLPGHADAVARAAAWMDTLDSGVDGSIPGVSKPITVIGVRVSGRPTTRQNLPWLLSDEAAPDRLGTVEAARRRYREVAAYLAGLGAGRPTTDRGEDDEHPQPLTETELWWLLTARRAAGHVIDADAGDVEVTATRGEPGTVPVTAATDSDGWPVTRHVHTMRVSVFKDRPDVAPPWLPAVLDSDARPTFTAMFDLVPGSDTRADDAEEHATRLRLNAEHAREHGARLDASTDSALATAETIADELADPNPVVSTRARGVVLVHVSGDSPQTCREAARRVRSDLAKGGPGSTAGPGLQLTSPPAQWAEYWAGVPGEVPGVDPLDKNRALPVGYVSEQPLAFLAASAPGCSMHAGGSQGWPVGNILGSHDAFLFDLFGGARANRSNVIGVSGEQGSGKTTFAAAQAYLATLAGVRTMVSDPSGGLAALASVPEIAARSRVLAIGRRTPGVLAPHTLVLDPERAAFDTDEEWQEALDDAAARRMAAAFDIVRMVPTMLPAQVRDEAHEAAQAAIGRVGGAYGLHPMRIIDAIEAEGEAGVRFARALRAYASMPDGQVFFGDPHLADSGHTLTVLTVEGFEAPPPAGTPESEWTTAQLQSRVVSYASTLMAGRLLWADRRPKLIVHDEQTSQVGEGGSAHARHLSRAATDSRKFAGAMIVIMHTAETLTRIDPGFVSLLGAHFAFRTAEANAAGFLPALRVREGTGWAERIERLDTGVAVARSWDDRVREVVVDRSWWPDTLVRALDSTPVQAREGITAAVGVW